MSPQKQAGCVVLCGLGALSLFLSACGGGEERPAGERAASDASTPEVQPLPAFVIVTPDTSIHSAELDSVSQRLTDSATGWRILNDPGHWAVDYTWFYLLNRPVEFLSFAQMESLAATGVINDSTTVGLAIYRVKVESEGGEDLLQKARSGQPTSVPAGLRSHLEH